MRATFNKYVMQWIEDVEGYKSNLKGDSGKLTIFGIASAYHPKEVALMNKMSKNDAREFAKDIYLREYWILNGCDGYPFPWDLIIFDSYVQHKIETVQALMKFGLTNWSEFLLRRLSYYNQLCKGNWKNRGGWVNRIVKLFNLCMME